MTHRESSKTRRVLAVQATYYLTSGLWPLVSPGSFQAVTGPKTEMWLVKTFGLLVTAIGATLGLAAARGRSTEETKVLALGSAGTLAGADAYYVARGRIAPTYLLDAAAQAALAAILVRESARDR